MTYLYLFVIYAFTILLSFYVFKKLINPLFVYGTIWLALLILYELKLLHYYELSTQTWVVIGGAFLSFVIGILTIHVLDQLEDNKVSYSGKRKFSPNILADGGVTLRNAIIFFGVIGLLSALQHWKVLLDQYGSIPNILIHLSKIYSMRVAGEIEGVIPYINVASYISIFLAGIYSAYKSRFTLISFLPFTAFILKGIANVGRQGILYGFLEYFISFFIFKYALSESEKFLTDKKKQRNFNSIVIIATFTILLIVSALFIKDFRGNDENYIGETRTIKTLKTGGIITPSLYLYLSSHVGVLNKYLIDENEPTRFGENTFQFIYNILSKVNFVSKQTSYQQGYYIPMWSNTGTYLRELYADFGVLGVYIIPYLMGLIVTYFWIRFFRWGSLTDLVIIVHVMLVISFSFLMMITRAANWFLSLFLIPLILYWIGKIAINKKTKIS